MLGWNPKFLQELPLAIIRPVLAKKSFCRPVVNENVIQLMTMRLVKQGVMEEIDEQALEYRKNRHLRENQ